MSDDLLVGRIDSAVGLKGEVAVRLFTNRLERLEPGSRLRSDHGEFSVLAARPLKDRFAVRFDGVDSREDADALRGIELWAPPIDDADELWVHELLGAELVDQDAVARGRVVRVLPNPASDLLELDSGALVPARFVISLEPNERVVVEVPDGIFDLS